MPRKMMQPEKGNPEIIVDEAMVCEAFHRAGVVSGDTVLFHGSLSSMGWVQGGPTCIFNGILMATAPGGTVAMPTLWYDGTEERAHPELFNVQNSPAFNGALADGMRKDSRSVRSLHFSHSISAIGARAEELTVGHDVCKPAPSPWSETAFGVGSPWQRLYEWNALYALIGVDFTVCTIKHLIESRMVMRLLSMLPTQAERQARRAELSKDRKHGLWPYLTGARIEEVLSQQGVLKKTMLGSATLRSVRTRPLLEVIGQDIWQQPEAWFAEEFLHWRKRVVTQGTGDCHE
ncbi:MAG: AAC(3) family N-acetyltransferase [Lentisphaerae bacterium]|nr:AAC(3) family N-acetyltransferase [Lentisphaerota bacterium]